MRKILFSDLDGTLINKQQQELHKGNFEAIKKWREAGNIFVLCTGRNPIDILPTLKVCDIEYDYLVLCNGASLYDAKGTCIFEKEFPLELGKEILLECSQNHDIITFYCDQNEMVMQFLNDVVAYDNQGNKHEIGLNKSFASYAQEATCFKMLCLIQLTGNNHLKYFEEKLLMPHKDEISWFFNKDCIDIMAHDISKGKGMMKLVEILGKGSLEVYAIGDSFNDISMVEMADHGFTFEDCVDELKVKAKHIVPSVAKLIENVLEGKF